MKLTRKKTSTSKTLYFCISAVTLLVSQELLAEAQKIVNPNQKLTTTYYYKDSDADGYGDPTTLTTTSTTGYVTNALDCNDSDATVNPTATDSCDQKDNDCNGSIDDGLYAVTRYKDADGDGYGDSASTTIACVAGYVSKSGDCNDNYASIHPSATEVCDAKDNDCNGTVDDGLTTTTGTYYKDTDKDGYGSGTTTYKVKCASGYSYTNSDCNDTSKGSSIHPGAPDSVTSANSTDDDCDGYKDDCNGLADSLEPRVYITSPSRGSFKTTSSLTVAGYVLPSRLGSAISSATVDGVSATLTQCSADGGKSFSKSTTTTKGLDTVPVVAKDATGKSDTARVSTVYASFVDLDTTKATSVLGSILYSGSWNIFADYLEDLFTSSEIEAMLKEMNPIVDEYDGDVTDDEIVCMDWYDLTAKISNYSHSSIAITPTLSGGKTKLSIKINNPQLDISGDLGYKFDWWCGGISDGTWIDFSVDASASSITASADVGWSVSSGKINVTMSNVSVSTSGFSMNVEADDWWDDLLIDLIEMFITDEYIGDLLEDEMEDVIKTETPQYLEDWLNETELAYSFSGAHTDYDVDFTYSTAGVSTSSSAPYMSLSMGLDYDLYSSSQTYDSGYPRVASSTSYSTASSSYDFALKASYDFFNATFFALWEGGEFNISNYPVTDSLYITKVKPLLPPVVYTSSSSSYLMKASFGDVQVDLLLNGDTGTPYNVRAYVSMDVNLTLDMDSNGNELWFVMGYSLGTVNYDWSENVVNMSSLDKTKLELGLMYGIGLAMAEAKEALEDVHISYADVPMDFTSFYLAKDSTNSMVISAFANAEYSP